MSTAGQSTGYQRIIIHHLSDLHYDQNSPDPLVQYSGFVQELEPARKPNLIVITGDLTATGLRQDLTTVAALLRQQFPRWTDRSDRIYIVPGPRDINWEGSDAPGLKTFYEVFRDFGIPSATHGVPAHTMTAQGTLNCFAYPLDTCYSLDDLLLELKEEFGAYGTAYGTFVEDLSKVQRPPSASPRTGPFGLFGRARPKDNPQDRLQQLDDLRQRYLQLTEANDLTLLDAGRVAPDDLKAFEGWIQSQGSGQSEPLKILITHHPLVVRPELKLASQGTQRKDTLFEQLATAARNAGFDLALHGHIHKPQVLSDLSLLQGSDTQHFIRQVGAGSLGDSGTFHEITATYSRNGDPQHWRLEIRTIDLRAKDPHEATTFVLLNPREDAAKHAADLELEQQAHVDFDRRVRETMRRFTDDIYRAQPESTQGGPVLLPQIAMQSVGEIIRDVVLPGYAVRTRLYLKDQQHGAVPSLRAVYLAPTDDLGSEPITYPDSLAALSLVLGRTLVYPAILKETLTNEDYEWLTRSGKNQELERILDELVRDPGPEGAKRYQDLRDKLKQGPSDPLHGAAFYRQGSHQGTQQTYQDFICVPYPRRTPAGMLPEKLEVAVLAVSVRAPELAAQGGGIPAPAGGQKPPIFSEARINLLENLTELAGLILISSSAVRKPRGIWEDRLWA
jgi:predicted phosphodiesterase